MDAYLGEIKITAFNFAPKDWAQCDGTSMAVQSNQALYALLGNYFGGTPGVNFNLPDFRGRVPRHPDYQSNVLQPIYSDRLPEEFGQF